MSPVIDVHTHCLTEAWFRLLQQQRRAALHRRASPGGLRAIHLDGAPFMTPVPAMFDYALRLATMNQHGVDVCICVADLSELLLGRPGYKPRGS